MHDRRDQDQETGNAAPKHRAPAAESDTEAEAVVFVCMTCEVL
ncbi:hypothetical protein [Streptomyces gardneri]